MDCCPGWGDYDDALLCRSIDLAWATLRTLSGGQVGNCPVLVRPWVTRPCSVCSSARLVHLPSHGETGCDGCWANTCGSVSGCTCKPMPEIVLPGNVAEVWQVKQDGVLLPVDAYRVDNSNRLLRTDGLSWPSCQDMIADVDQPGTLAVWYVPGTVVDSSAQWAAGVLTCEFAKACSGGKCRLPAAVTSIARQGVTMDIPSGMFPDGMTGIREVDAFLTSVNPNALRITPKVWSPDLVAAKHRYTTWSIRPPGMPEEPG